MNSSVYFTLHISQVSNQNISGLYSHTFRFLFPSSIRLFFPLPRREGPSNLAEIWATAVSLRQWRSNDPQMVFNLGWRLDGASWGARVRHHYRRTVFVLSLERRRLFLKQVCRHWQPFHWRNPSAYLTLIQQTLWSPGCPRGDHNTLLLSFTECRGKFIKRKFCKWCDVIVHLTVKIR